MPRITLPVAALCAALFASIFPALAQEHHGRHAEAFARADANRDGVLDREEAQNLPRLAKHFDSIDADGNGSLAPEEIRNHMRARMQAHRERGQQRFAKADVNGDGVIDRDEAQATPRLARKFDAIDADGSGTVSRVEIHAYRKGKRQARHC